MNKILVLGGSGMLGSMVTRVLSEEKSFNVTATYRTEHPNIDGRWEKLTLNCFDSNLEVLTDVVKGFDYVINCIGITKPYIKDLDGESVMRAININSRFPYELTLCCANAKIITIATDCVFSGKSETGYHEESPHDATDVYGKTKSLGEHRGMILRTSIIGPSNGEYLWNWFVDQKPNAEVSGFNNHLWNGVTTFHFAKVVSGIIAKDLYQPSLTHLIPENSVSKYTLLQCLGTIRPDIKINEVTASPCNRTLTSNYSVFNKQLWHAAGYDAAPTVQQMIRECIEYCDLDKKVLASAAG